MPTLVFGGTTNGVRFLKQTIFVMGGGALVIFLFKFLDISATEQEFLVQITFAVLILYQLASLTEHLERISKSLESLDSNLAQRP